MRSISLPRLAKNMLPEPWYIYPGPRPLSPSVATASWFLFRLVPSSPTVPSSPHPNFHAVDRWLEEHPPTILLPTAGLLTRHSLQWFTHSPIVVLRTSTRQPPLSMARTNPSHTTLAALAAAQESRTPCHLTTLSTMALARYDCPCIIV